MITEIGATELRDKVADVLDQVRFTRQPVTVTRHGKPVALIVGVTADFENDADFTFALGSLADALNRSAS